MPVYYPAKSAPTITLLESTFGNDKGDMLKVLMETDGEIYYYDSFRRWCYLEKIEEGTAFEWKKRPVKE
jgi:hypothetical protein